MAERLATLLATQEAEPDLRLDWKRWLFSVTLRQGARSQALQLRLKNGLNFLQ
jgi:hypothetical protein